MGNKAYLGGGTIVGPRNDPYRLENTRHDYISEYRGRPQGVFWERIADDLFDELDGYDFDYVCAVFSALQHAFLHGDLTVIARIAENDELLGSYTLRLMNKVMTGRKFDKQKGKVIIRKSGKLEWNANQIVAVYRAMIAAHDADFDEIPDIHPNVQKLVDRQSSEMI
jgi:hypothetical protein